MIKKCAFCGEEFETTNEKKLYCSNECRYKNKLERDKKKYYEEKAKNPLPKRICAVCGESFVPNRIDRVICCKCTAEGKKKPAKSVRRAKRDPGSLDRKIKEAKELGMSYGKMQAMKNAEVAKVRV